MAILTPYPVKNTAVPHYYGDIVRRLFFLIAIVMVITHPFYANVLRMELPFTVLAALILVALAALTNPHNKGLLMADGIAAGVGVLIYQTWALFEYDSSTWLELGLRQGIALLFMIAFYFAMKTFRAMLLGKIGRKYEPGEFNRSVDEEEGSPSYSEDLADKKTADHRFRSFRMRNFDIEHNPDEDRSPRSSARRDSSPEYVNPYLQPKDKDESTEVASAEYEQRRRGGIDAEKARRDKELEDIAAGRQ